MAGVLGLRDTGSYSAQVFQNWRRTILYSFPNGACPLTALLSLTEPEDTDDAHFHWHELDLPTQRTKLTAAYANGDAVIKIADLESVAVGDEIMNEATGEIMNVVGIDSTGLILNVVRGNWVVQPVASSTATDAILVIGQISEEGGRSPQEQSEDPNAIVNYTQIMRAPFSETGTALNTSLKWDETGPYKELSRQALQRWGIKAEKSFIFGQKAEWLDPISKKTKRTTGGVLSFLAPGYGGLQPDGTYGLKPADAAGGMTPDEWSNWQELVFRVCSNSNNEKLVLLGSGALNTLNRLAEKVGKMETVAGDESFGMSLTRWVNPFGTLYLRTHPLFTQHPTYRYAALVLDVHNLNYRYMQNRDVDLYTNRQLPDEDMRKDEWLGECGLEFHHAGTSDVNGDNAVNGSHLFLSNLKSANQTQT